MNIFQVDAFTSEVFRGNPAAVCPLESWLTDDLLQSIASENNLSETAFFVKEGDHYRLRWFTPKTEVDLCGHATLATAFVLYSKLGCTDDPLVFQTRSGELRVRRGDHGFTMDFPAREIEECTPPSELLPALGIGNAETLGSEDFLVVVESESQVRALNPDFSKLFGLPRRGVIVTATGDNHDFVSRWFGPNVGVNEDPVTGSAHCALTPYWASRLGKSSMRAAQISERGGELSCELKDGRVYLTGNAVLYLTGEIMVPSSG